MEAWMRSIDFEKGGGTITAIAQDVATDEILMLGHMNEEALRETVESGRVVYWSRSRGRLWRKGEESGNVQKLVGLFIDCDGDAVLLRVEQVGDAACHTGKRSCFFRKLEDGGFRDVGVQIFDPEEVYGRR